MHPISWKWKRVDRDKVLLSFHVHGLNIKDGKATSIACFVKTSKLQQEEYYGVAKFVKASLLMRNNMWTRNHLLANNVPLALDVILEYCSLTMRFARVWLCATWTSWITFWATQGTTSQHEQISKRHDENIDNMLWNVTGWGYVWQEGHCVWLTS
jgi:hypothetical protein